MDETEFLNLTDHLFDRIETALDRAEIDVDIDRNGNVLQLGFEDNAKLVINRHLPNHEIWLAARSGGYHYRQDAAGEWCDTRGGSTFQTRLTELIRQHGGEAFDWHAGIPAEPR